MTSELRDFNKAWLAKFNQSLSQLPDDKLREAVMEGSEDLQDATTSVELISWTRDAMQRLNALVDEPMRRAVMTACACRYPTSQLRELRRTFAETGDLDLVHGMLQRVFEAFLRDDLGLTEDLVGEIVGRGWGLAGVKNGRTIIATKIPKSGHLASYLAEKDPAKRQRLYCHCPRVREAIEQDQTLPITYCYCGAGFYKALWEEIVQDRVEVEVLESVLAGGDVCTIAIYLP